MTRPAIPTGAVTQLLRAQADGDAEAIAALFELVYGELRRIARARRRSSSTPLATTELVHEAYLKLERARPGGVARDRAHFFAVAATAMRQIAVDLARAERRDKRGGDAHHTALDEESARVVGHAEEVLAVDQALRRLAEEEPRWAAIVECRYFAGFSEEETAEALQVSLSTVQRGWREARTWLRGALRAEQI